MMDKDKNLNTIDPKPRFNPLMIVSFVALAVLFGIFIIIGPVLEDAKDKGRQASCAVNLKNIVEAQLFMLRIMMISFLRKQNGQTA